MPHIFLTSLLLAALYSTDRTAGDVVVIAGNSLLTFESIEATFAPIIGGSGVSGILMQGNPANACSTLDALPISTPTSLIMLTRRGDCSFEVKVRNAQRAGFSAVIIYANEYLSRLVTKPNWGFLEAGDMRELLEISLVGGNPEGIHVHAVYVTREAGETLLQYLEDKSSEIQLLPTYKDSLWSVEVLSFVSMLAFGAAIATRLITKNRQIRRLCSRLLRQQEPCVMSSCIVKAMPSITYTMVGVDQKAAGDSCGICLEAYKANQKLRILPCRHRFHSRCVDTWLTAWHASCPVCKCDVWFASEKTPLLRTTSSQGPCEGRKISSELQLQSNLIHLSACSQGKAESSSHKSGNLCIGDRSPNNANSLRISSPTSSLTAFCICGDIIPSQ